MSAQIVPPPESGRRSEHTYDWGHIVAGIGSIVVIAVALSVIAFTLRRMSAPAISQESSSQIVAYYQGVPAIELGETAVNYRGKRVGTVVELDPNRSGLQLTFTLMRSVNRSAICTVGYDRPVHVDGIHVLFSNSELTRVSVQWRHGSFILTRTEPNLGPERPWRLSDVPDSAAFMVNGRPWRQLPTDEVDASPLVWRGDRFQLGEVQMTWNDPETFFFIRAAIDVPDFVDRAGSKGHGTFRGILGAGSYAAIQNSLGLTRSVIELEPRYGRPIGCGEDGAIELSPYEGFDLSTLASDISRYLMAPASLNRRPRNRFETVVADIGNVTASLGSISERTDALVAQIQDKPGYVGRLVLGEGYDEVIDLLKTVNTVTERINQTMKAHESGGLLQHYLLEPEQQKSLTDALANFEKLTGEFTREGLAQDHLSLLDAVAGRGTSARIKSIMTQLESELEALSNTVQEGAEDLTSAGKTTLLLTAALAVAGILGILGIF